MRISKVVEFFKYLESEVGPDANVVLFDTDEGHDYLNVNDVRIVKAKYDNEKEIYGDEYILISRVPEP